MSTFYLYNGYNIQRYYFIQYKQNFNSIVIKVDDFDTKKAMYQL